MKDFEERLLRLEALSEAVRKNEIPLDEAIVAFEEGIKLARNLEKDLDSLEKKVEVLMNEPDEAPPTRPELDLFNGELGS